VHSRVVLADGGNFTAILLDELAGPVADSTKALDNESLVFDAESREAARVNEGFLVEKFACGVVNTESSALSAAFDTALLNVLSGAAAFGVDVVFTSDLHVGVLDPRHHLLVCAHIGAQTVDSCSNKTFLDKFHRVLAGDSLEFS